MSASFASSVSRSHPSEWVSTSVAKTLVWSDIGLSCFDYPLDRKNRDTVCTLLTDLPFKIVAVWVCARPVNGYSRGSFEHWCVKIQAPPALISIDFLESKKKGAFGLQQTTATDAELEDFLHFYIKDDNGKKKKKWQIVSSVTPSPLKNTSYLKYMDDHELKKLKSFMKKNKKSIATKDDPDLVKSISINRKVCDIADFLGMWTESENIKKLKNKKNHKNDHKNDKNGNKAMSKSYNPITANCQQFAADLFEYLVGHKKNYKTKVQDVKNKVQSPFDKKRYGIKKNKKNKNSKHSKKSSSSSSSSSHSNSYLYDENEEKEKEYKQYKNNKKRYKQESIE